MATKIVIYFLLCFYTLQHIESKAVKGYGSSVPVLIDATIDPEIGTIITEIQMRLKQLQSTANYVIGSSVGLASKDVGLIASAVKENIKLVISLVNDNPNAAEQCIDASKLALDQMSTDAKAGLSSCTKSSQFHLKVLGQEQRTISLRVTALNTELYLNIHRCKLEHPLPTDSALVNECMRIQCNTINQTIADYEDELLNSVASFTVAITQIVSGAQSCSQQVLILLEEQTDQIRKQIDECSIANNASNSLL